MNIRKKLSPNITKGRNNWKPDMIVCHISEGYYESGCNWLCNPESEASTHFFVSKKGEITQLVDIQNTAWCNGSNNTGGDSRYNGSSNLQLVRERKTSANYYTISIEHEGFYKDNRGQLTDLQLSATIKLIKYIRQEVKQIYNIDIPIDRQHIVGHCDIVPKWKPNCPGQNFQFDDIIKRLNPSNNLATNTNTTTYKISESNLSSLINLGVISSPDYWRGVSLQYLNDLINNAITTSTLDKNVNNGITDFNIALKVLADAKIINSPDYWIGKNKTVKYLGQLLINIANKCKIILDKIVQAEACGEDEKGMILVANVIFNRVKSKNFPNSIYDVVYQPSQFSPITDGGYDKAVPSGKVKSAVNKALSGIDYSQGALFFRMINGASPDCWHEIALIKLFDHGCHRFYK